MSTPPITQGLLILAGAMDAALVAFTAHRVVRSRRRGLSLRLRIFLALSAASLAGALATGVYATALDAATLGFSARFAQVLPKGFLLASTLLPMLALGAAWGGARLARPVERLSEAAARIAEGESESETPMQPGRGAETVKLSRALTAMRRELADKPYAAAFLRDAWHDLKTPVAAISATLEVLEDGALDDPEASRRFVANLRRSTEQLDRLLQDLVTLARFETSALRDPEPADLEALARSTIEAVAPLALARDVHVALTAASVRRGQEVRVDRGAITRALTNLLENAIRASPGGRVSLSISAGDDRAARDVLVVLVTNEPATIAVDVRERLFRRAALAARPRGADDTARPGGSGLGLAIARAAIEAHGGSVRFVEMGPPRVTVRVELPR